ncbi:MAG: hypothetical protein Q9195_006562 [Heterodermia aff. obscurata]
MDHGFLLREHSAPSKSYISSRPDCIVLLTLLATLVYLWILWPARASVPVLSHHKGWTAPWKDAVRYLKDSPGVLKEGYQKGARYTISPIVQADKFHLATITTTLTPQLVRTVDDVLDEVRLAFADEIGDFKGLI